MKDLKFPNLKLWMLENIVNAISTIGSDDEVLTLVELYEVSKSNHHRMNELLTLTLGSIGDDKVIPILIEEISIMKN